MEVLKIPFNEFLGLKLSDNIDNSFILKIEDKIEYHNHLGTTHASVLFALAEATSGEFLLQKFEDFSLDIIPVVRKVELKYSKLGKGEIFSKAYFVSTTTDEIIETLLKSKRTMIKVKVELFDKDSDKIMHAIFDWFITSLN